MRRLLVIMLLLAGCGTPQGDPPPAPGDDRGAAQGGNTTEPDADAAFRLAVDPDSGAPGAQVDLVIVNDGAETVEMGAEYRLDRREGESWESVLTGDEAWTMELYVIEPGRELRRPFMLPAEPGRYRVAKSTQGPGGTAAAEFTVE